MSKESAAIQWHYKPSIETSQKKTVSCLFSGPSVNYIPSAGKYKRPVERAVYIPTLICLCLIIYHCGLGTAQA